MKNTLIILAALFFSAAVFAQKGKEKQKEKETPKVVGVPTKEDEKKETPKVIGVPTKAEDKKETPKVIGLPTKTDDKKETPKVIGVPDKKKEKDEDDQGEDKKGHKDWKGKGKGKEKDNDQGDEHDRKVWGGIGDQSCMKPSKNQPAKVTSSFNRDYPNAGTVRWTKCRGDWTATFNNGIWRSTAVYHANGNRKDTRTPIRVEDAPKSIFDKVIGANAGTKVEEVVKIESPELPNTMPGKIIYRAKVEAKEKAGQPQYLFLNAKGETVKYNY